MAHIPSQDYGSRVDNSDPTMPQGKAKNIVGTTRGTGTPLEANWVNDIWGFKQAILKEAGITPSGDPDTADESQYLEGLKKITRRDNLAIPYLFTTEAKMLSKEPLGGEVFTNYEVEQTIIIVGESESVRFFTVVNTVSDIDLGDGVWAKLLAAITKVGERGNPYTYNTLEEFKEDHESLSIGDWVEILGKYSKFDGKNALYLMVDTTEVGIGDGDDIIDFTDKKAYKISSKNNGDNKLSNYPYDFTFPTDEVSRQEMLSNIANNSIGSGGSTWWVRPTSVGRKERGVDVVYRGDTYGSPEDRDLPQGSTDTVLWTNKRLGEAIIKSTRVELGATPTYSYTALNDIESSYREDEHHQPSMWFNGLSGQINITWGARNSGRYQDGSDSSNDIPVRYGQDTKTLSKSEIITAESTVNYGQGFFVGSTTYIFKRVSVGQWDYIRGTGGQNFKDPVTFLKNTSDELTDQFYLCTSFIDKSAEDTLSPTDPRSIVQVFGQPHPTNNPDSLLYHCQLEFIPAGTAPSDPARDFGGLYAKVLSDGSYLGGGGRLDNTFEGIDKTDMDVVYTPPVGYRTRLLDVQYGDTPRALIAQWQATWDLPETMPFGTTYDIIMVTFDGTTTSTLTLASGVRGDLGFNKYQSAVDSAGEVLDESGVEGTTYAFGASFYRGKDYTDLEPIVYYCGREGSNENAHYMKKITLSSDYTAISTTEDLISGSSEIIYRPEMTLGGDKRILFYNSGKGWSSFNSWVAETKFIDETI